MGGNFHAEPEKQASESKDDVEQLIIQEFAQHMFDEFQEAIKDMKKISEKTSSEPLKKKLGALYGALESLTIEDVTEMEKIGQQLEEEEAAAETKEEELESATE